MIRFDGRTFLKAYDAQQDDEVIQEFVPRGQSLDHWTELVAVRAYQQLDDPLAYANAMLAEVQKNDPDAQPAIITDKVTGGTVVSFLVWPEDRSFVEFNIFRLEKRDAGGLVSQQFAQRVYGDDAERYVADQGAERERLTKLMFSEGLLIKPAPRDESTTEPEAVAVP